MTHHLQLHLNKVNSGFSSETMEWYQEAVEQGIWIAQRKKEVNEKANKLYLCLHFAI